MKRQLIAWLAATAITLVSISPIVASSYQVSDDPKSWCEMNDGTENRTHGTLLYFINVLEDAEIKYRMYKAGDRDALQNIELNNDYLCHMPPQERKHAIFWASNLLIFIFDITSHD